MGAVRYNLDPCGRKSDIQLWRALEQVYVYNTLVTINVCVFAGTIGYSSSFVRR